MKEYHTQCNTGIANDLTGAVVACTGPTQDRISQQPIMDQGEPHGIQLFHAGILSTDGFRSKDRHCLRGLSKMVNQLGAIYTHTSSHG